MALKRRAIGMPYSARLMYSDFKMKDVRVPDSIKSNEALKGYVQSEFVSVSDVLMKMGYGVFQDTWKEDVVHIHAFDGEFGDDHGLLFSLLAPYVEDGSTIEYIGEDLSLWRFRFQGGKAFEDEGRTQFERSDVALHTNDLIPSRK